MSGETVLIGHGTIKRFQSGITYLPKHIWDQFGGNEAEYIRNMSSLFIFKLGMDPELLLMSIDIIRKYIEKQVVGVDD